MTVTPLTAGYVSDAMNCIKLCKQEGALITSNSWGGIGYSSESLLLLCCCCATPATGCVLWCHTCRGCVLWARVRVPCASS